MKKLKAIVLLGVLVTCMIPFGCGGDACSELFDELAKCNFGTTASSSTGTSSGDDGTSCDETAAARAKCVIDSHIDVCKRATDPDTKKTYDECQTVSPSQ
jgi:hypothetical protein